MGLVIVAEALAGGFYFLAMPTAAEILAASQSKLDQILAETAPKPVEKTLTLSVPEAAVQVAYELGKSDIGDERRLYLSEVMHEIAKVNSEGTNTSISIKVIDDPMRQKESTERIATIQTLASAKPDSVFATNLHAVIGKADLETTEGKFQLAMALLTDREKLRKSDLTDALDDLQTMFGLTDDDMKNSYDISWRVGDAIRALADAAKVERILKKSDDRKADAVAAWPADMTSAKFDAVTKSYSKDELPWGYDQASKR